MSIKITTSVDLHDVEVEVEVDDEMIYEALEACDDPSRFFTPEIRVSAEQAYYHFARQPSHEVPDCVRQLLWHTIGRTL